MKIMGVALPIAMVSGMDTEGLLLCANDILRIFYLVPGFRVAWARSSASTPFAGGESKV